MQKKQIVVIFIKNSTGDFSVHQRLSTKKSFPNKFGIGAGGHVEEGEELSVAAVRELKEETKLSVPVKYLFSEDFDMPEINQTSHLFIAETDEPIEIDESEWQWSGWMKKEEVDELYEEDKLCIDTGVLYQAYLKLGSGT
jgi:8-oxo-dGTP pyrophosphatase MutT (NUDIX family)